MAERPAVPIPIDDLLLRHEALLERAALLERLVERIAGDGSVWAAMTPEMQDEVNELVR